MDPDTALKRMIEHAERILTDRKDGDPVELANAVDSLHMWILRGGKLPRAWQRSR